MGHRILVVSGQVALRAHFARLLSAARYTIDVAESPTHARRIGLKGFALAIVAPAGLGAGAGDLIDKLQAATGKPVLVVENGKLHDPSLGIIDASDETALLARVDSLLNPAVQLEQVTPVQHFSNYILDFDGHSLKDRTGREILLTRSEFRLLQEFLQRPGRVLSRDRLLQILAGRDAESYDRSIDMLVMRLRRKIELDPKRPRIIATVPGSGYKFMAEVKGAEVSARPVLEDNASTEDTPAPAERRQVTAISIELLSADSRGPTADPEELHRIVNIYRHRATAIVTRFGGTVAQRVGREVLAYFGHPVAQEDAAERAIHAGFNLVGRDAEIPIDLPVRVGIATGLVVADPAGEVIGNASSDAAQMRNLAESGQVIVEACTRQLGGRLFSYRDLESMTMGDELGLGKGWQVLAPSSANSRSEALYEARSTPLVGRSEERFLLLHAWQQAKSRRGRVVLLSGEPGIGKSRLLVELEEWLAPEPHASSRYFCSPLHQGSALHPIIVRWEQEAGFARDDTSAQRLRKLKAVVSNDEFSPADVALLADLLGVLTDVRHREPELSPQQRKDRTFALLCRRLAFLANRQPLLMLFEDAQWADPSSLELIDTLVSQIEELPILLIISFRPNSSRHGLAGRTLI